MSNSFDVEIIDPGRPTGKYTSDAGGQLRLEEILYPEQPRTFDLAVFHKTRTSQGENLPVLLLSAVSHPPRTTVTARFLGGIDSDVAGFVVVAVPIAEHEAEGIQSIDDLAEAIRNEIADYFQRLSENGQSVSWEDQGETEKIIKQASLKYRQAAAEKKKQDSSAPAWQPIDRGGRVTGYTEAEHYTDAEYTFFQLPYHFQYYVSGHLSDDERILYAVRRPAMRSRLQRSWLGGVKLQEGVLILTTQRLLHLVELTPPDSSGIRYGFNSQLAPVERLDGVSIELTDKDTLRFKTRWAAKGGQHNIEWEYPTQARQPLSELCGFLQQFIADNHHGLALRNADPPAAPESLPVLRDPAANSPDELELVNQRFESLLPGLLAPGEIAHAWALWPAWFEKRGFPQVLLVTNQRLRIIPDPSQLGQQYQDVQLSDITMLEYEGSILSSHMRIFVPQGTAIKELRLHFPYPAESAFHTCFEALRRCMAVVPL